MIDTVKGITLEVQKLSNDLEQGRCSPQDAKEQLSKKQKTIDSKLLSAKRQTYERMHELPLKSVADNDPGVLKTELNSKVQAAFDEFAASTKQLNQLIATKSAPALLAPPAATPAAAAPALRAMPAAAPAPRNNRCVRITTALMGPAIAGGFAWWRQSLFPVYTYVGGQVVRFLIPKLMPAPAPQPAAAAASASAPALAVPVPPPIQQNQSAAPTAALAAAPAPQPVVAPAPASVAPAPAASAPPPSKPGDQRGAAPDRASFTYEQLNAKTPELSDENILSHKVYHSHFANVNYCSKTAIKNPEAHIVGQGPFLGANEIKISRNRTFIASQYPHHSALAGYWRLFEERGAFVVDLTDAVDLMGMVRRGGGVYYPVNQGTKLKLTSPNGEEVARIVCEENREVGNGLTLSTYRYTRSGRPPFTVKRLHCEGWPSHTALTLDQTKLLIQTIAENTTSSNQTIAVHCGAGQGRTGSLIAELLIKEAVDNGMMGSENLNDVVFVILSMIREQRNPKCIETEGQFEMILDYARNLVAAREALLNK